LSWLSDLTRYIVDGGPVMIPIAIASIVGLAAFLERLIALRRDRVAPRGLVVEAMELLRQGRYDDALTLCRKREAAVARILEVGIQVRGQPREVIKERLEEVGRREAAEMERFIPIVGTVASISPLLGLLGTVGGMIATFAAIQEQGMGDIDKLAGGISQALITTFAGLSVGIPALIGNRFLLGRVDRQLIELEEASLLAIELLSQPDVEPVESATTGGDAA
jgi:biopolymer transport protein ExbB